jgi:hypothetical protein
MSVRSGRETKRHPLEVYKGFRIIKTEHITYHRSLWDNTRFDKNWIDRKEVYFNFCKEGEEKYPSKDYQVGAKNVAECQEAIDKFLSGDSKDNGDIYYTHEEFQKYVKKPNEKCDYAYGYDSLMKLMRQHQKADKRMQWFLEERLHDANFHTEGDILSTCDYAKFEEYVTNTNPFKEKFEVCTKTLKKRIKDPQTLVEGMNKVIADYLASQGIKDTSVNVRFIENW